MKNLKKPRAVLFDWDGTLVDSSAAILSGHNHVRRVMGYNDFTQEEFIHASRIGNARETFSVLYPDRAQEAVDLYYGHVPTARAQTVTLVEQAENFLKKLGATGIPLGVVSNMRHSLLLDEIYRLGWNPYFETIVGAGEAPRGKPAPDAIYLAAERMRLPRSDLGEVWFVGDTEADEKAARAAGCPFFYYAGGFSDETERQNIQAHVKFGDYGQLWTLVCPIVDEGSEK